MSNSSNDTYNSQNNSDPTSQKEYNGVRRRKWGKWVSEIRVPGTPHRLQKEYNGVRRRKWGKWVSEIRVPGTPHRLWLGSYATPEAAAVAHDVATYCLRGDSSLQKLNFPLVLPEGARFGLSPSSVQKVASDAGLAVDASFRCGTPS